MLRFFIVLAVCFIAGDFGFAQIIGSIQNYYLRGPALTIITCVIWVAVLTGVTIGAIKIGHDGVVPILMGYGIALAMVLSAGRIQR